MLSTVVRPVTHTADTAVKSVGEERRARQRPGDGQHEQHGINPMMRPGDDARPAWRE